MSSRREAMKTYERWIEQLPKGWTLDLTKGGHVSFMGPQGERATFPQSPSDHRAMKNSRAFLRRLSGVRGLR